MLSFNLLQALAITLKSNRKIGEVLIERELGLYDLVRTGQSLEFIIIFRAIFVCVCNLVLIFIIALR